IFSHYDDHYIQEEDENDYEIHERRNSTDGGESDNSIRSSRGLRRRSARAIEKAKEQIKQGFLLLKNGGGAINHANNKEKRRSSSVSFSDIQTLEVPQWQESNPPPQPSTRRTSNSSRSVSFSDQPPSPGSTKSSQNSY
ncbi:24465_t:CDS:1, partial [Gigaspora rosea]